MFLNNNKISLICKEKSGNLIYKCYFTDELSLCNGRVVF